MSSETRSCRPLARARPSVAWLAAPEASVLSFPMRMSRSPTACSSSAIRASLLAMACSQFSVTSAISLISAASRWLCRFSRPRSSSSSSSLSLAAARRTSTSLAWDPGVRPGVGRPAAKGLRRRAGDQPPRRQPPPRVE